MNCEAPVRFCERSGERFPRATRCPSKATGYLEHPVRQPVCCGDYREFKMRLLIFYTLSIVPVLLFLAGCDSASDTLGDAEEVPMSEIVESEEWSRLVELRIEGFHLLSEAMKQDVTKERVLAAIKADYTGRSGLSSSGDQIEALIFRDDVGTGIYSRKVLDARADLITRFPVLAGQQSAEFISCSSEGALDEARLEAFVNLVANDGPPGGWETALSASSDCAWFKLLLCTGGCAILMPGTPSFLFCEWMCICTFCDHSVDWVDALCGLPGRE